MTPTLIEFAKQYIAIGVKPIPVPANCKFPTIHDWPNVAARTAEEAMQLFASHNGNIGLAMPPTLFAIDLDRKNGNDGVAELEAIAAQHGGLPPTLTQRTPSGGEHRIYSKPANVRFINKVGAIPGVDIRAEGTQIIAEPSMYEGKKYSWLDWDVINGEPPVIAVAPPWLINLMQDGQPQSLRTNSVGATAAKLREGGRNDAMFRIACSIRRTGLDEDAILAGLRIHNANVCVPPLLDNELQGIAHSAGKYPPEITTGDFPLLPPFSAYRLADRTADKLFVGPPKPVAWLIERVFPVGKVVIVASPPGVGKSFLSLEVAVSVASHARTLGADYCFGGAVKTNGRVVVISAEDDLDELHRRLDSLLGIRPMPERLHIKSLPDEGHFCFVQSDGRKNMTPTPAWIDLKRRILELGDVKLIIVDTLQALSAGDLNAAEIAQATMNELTEAATKSGATVLALHHLTKGAANPDRGLLSAQNAMDAIRGSGAITGSVRAAYCLFPHPHGLDVCTTMGVEYEEGKVIYGLVAKANGEARRDRTIYVRDDRGILQDRTREYNIKAKNCTELLDADLLAEIIKAHDDGNGFAISMASNNGLFKRRHQLPTAFHDQRSAWFAERANDLVRSGKLREQLAGNGGKYAPALTGNEIPKMGQEL